MTETSNEQNIFRIGICMAGAVSAGAYTAGVMDYLLEALEAYEKVRGTKGYPSHQIEIPVIGGASAGGMTAMITAAAFQQGIEHITQPPTNILEEQTQNILYHSWVDLTDRDMFSRMLETDDIKDADVVSALNCKFIDDVAKRVIKPSAAPTGGWKPLPGFFANRLKVFTTLSNLEGFTCDVSFNASGINGQRPYYMQLHNDYACFELLKPGVNGTSRIGWMQFDVSTGLHSQEAMDAAMATGAFPVGLRPRTLSRTKDVVNDNPLFDKQTLAAIKLPGNATDAYESLNVDGGMINNEPFDKIREVLSDITDQKKPNEYEDYKTFKSTTLMIAPFPSTKPQSITLVEKLLQVCGLTLSAMISQMRVKASQIQNAINPGCAGQYLIDPSRYVTINGQQVTVQGERAIACGALGGFSGFLNKEFRVHDFFLGRYNCEVFLREYFTIPATDAQVNPIFQKGYEGIPATDFCNKKGERQIIPIVNKNVPVFPNLVFSSGGSWPKQQSQDIEVYTGALKKRIGAIIMNLVKYKPVSKFFLWIGTWVVLRGMLAKSAMKTVMQELKKWDLV